MMNNTTNQTIETIDSWEGLLSQAKNPYLSLMRSETNPSNPLLILKVSFSIPDIPHMQGPLSEEACSKLLSGAYSAFHSVRGYRKLDLSSHDEPLELEKVQSLSPYPVTWGMHLNGDDHAYVSNEMVSGIPNIWGVTFTVCLDGSFGFDEQKMLIEKACSLTGSALLEKDVSKLRLTNQAHEKSKNSVMFFRMNLNG